VHVLVLRAHGDLPGLDPLAEGVEGLGDPVELGLGEHARARRGRGRAPGSPDVVGEEDRVPPGVLAHGEPEEPVGRGGVFLPELHHWWIERLWDWWIEGWGTERRGQTRGATPTPTIHHSTNRPTGGGLPPAARDLSPRAVEVVADDGPVDRDRALDLGLLDVLDGGVREGAVAGADLDHGEVPEEDPVRGRGRPEGLGLGEGPPAGPDDPGVVGGGRRDDPLAVDRDLPLQEVRQLGGELGVGVGRDGADVEGHPAAVGDHVLRRAPLDPGDVGRGRAEERVGSLERVAGEPGHVARGAGDRVVPEVGARRVRGLALGLHLQDEEPLLRRARLQPRRLPDERRRQRGEVRPEGFEAVVPAPGLLARGEGDEDGPARRVVPLGGEAEDGRQHRRPARLRVHRPPAVDLPVHARRGERGVRVVRRGGDHVEVGVQQQPVLPRPELDPHVVVEPVRHEPGLADEPLHEVRDLPLLVGEGGEGDHPPVEVEYVEHGSVRVARYWRRAAASEWGAGPSPLASLPRGGRGRGGGRCRRRGRRRLPPGPCPA
jgi:hypothetical protein